MFDKNMDFFNLKPGESEENYINRIIGAKSNIQMTWNDVANIINDKLGYNYSPDKYRKQASKRVLEDYVGGNESIYNEDSIAEAINYTMLDLKKERVKISDELSQNNRLIRKMAREETIKEIAEEFCKSMDKEYQLNPIKVKEPDAEHKNVGILQLSDIHYGIEINSVWNQYNTDIAKKRIEKLRDKVIEYIDTEKIQSLMVVNLGDLIAGRIHLPIRLNSRIDVISQIMEISELIAQFLYDLSKYTQVYYVSTGDNHSRLDPNKDDSWELESLCRITDWYLKDRCKEVVNFIANEFSDDIASFNIGNYRVAAVHGDKRGDKQNKVVQNLTMFTGVKWDLVLTAHLHHLFMNEQNMSLVISNGSMMGTDSFAQDLRLCARPSQNLIITTNENICEKIIPIWLDKIE